MKQLILVAVGMVLTAFSFSQQVTGLVKDEKGNGLASATAVLKKSKDSSSVKFAISNQEGHYTFSNIEKGSYFVSVSFIGYNEQSSASFELNGSGTVSVPAVQRHGGVDATAAGGVVPGDRRVERPAVAGVIDEQFRPEADHQPVLQALAQALLIEEFDSVYGNVHVGETILYRL